MRWPTTIFGPIKALIDGNTTAACVPFGLELVQHTLLHLVNTHVTTIWIELTIAFCVIPERHNDAATGKCESQ